MRGMRGQADYGAPRLSFGLRASHSSKFQKRYALQWPARKEGLYKVIVREVLGYGYFKEFFLGVSE